MTFDCEKRGYFHSFFDGISVATPVSAGTGGELNPRIQHPVSDLLDLWILYPLMLYPRMLNPVSADTVSTDAVSMGYSILYLRVLYPWIQGLTCPIPFQAQSQHWTSGRTGCDHRTCQGPISSHNPVLTCANVRPATSWSLFSSLLLLMRGVKESRVGCSPEIF